MPAKSLITRVFPPMVEAEQLRADRHMKAVYSASPVEGSGWVNTGCGFWSRRFANTVNGDVLYAAHYDTDREVLQVYRIVTTVTRP